MEVRDCLTNCGAMYTYLPVVNMENTPHWLQDIAIILDRNIHLVPSRLYLLSLVSTVRGCSLQMPRGGCSALPRTLDTGVARYEAYASHNVRRAMCLSVLEQCSKVTRSELCVKWIPALSASHHTRHNSALQTNKPPQRNCHHG
ncbi:hypothetical protein J6590_052970 [Homalodisca vitripennis]|nr:hypothetical protein J6590_052970 [Homalodisca vitripennis]